MKTKKQSNKCKHDNGWLIVDEFVVTNNFDSVTNNDFECDFMCNNYGCTKRIRLRFDIKNVEEVNEDE